MADENLCFERTITSTWKDFLLQMLGSSVVEVTSFVYTETITLFDLRDSSRIFTSISKNIIASYQLLSSLTSFGLRLLSQYFTLRLL